MQNENLMCDIVFTAKTAAAKFKCLKFKNFTALKTYTGKQIALISINVYKK